MTVSALRTLAAAALLAAGCGPKEDSAELVRIGALLDRGNAAGAEQRAQAYVKRHPAHALGWVILAKVLDQRDKPDEAVAANRRALELDPRAAQAHTNLGIIHRRRKEYDLAMESYRKAVEIDPGHAQAWSSMAVIELKRNRDAEALAFARKAATLDPEDPVMAANLAVALHYNGQVEERDQAFETARRLGYKKMDALQDIFDGKTTVRD